MRIDLHDHIQALGLDNNSNLFEESISYLFKLPHQRAVPRAVPYADA